VRGLEGDVSSAQRIAEERERLAKEVEALTEERRGHFFAVHELETKLRRAAADADELRNQARCFAACSAPDGRSSAVLVHGACWCVFVTGSRRQAGADEVLATSLQLLPEHFQTQTEE
jgi:uncharacterized protein (UPF0335 family)